MEISRCGQTIEELPTLVTLVFIENGVANVLDIKGDGVGRDEQQHERPPEREGQPQVVTGKLRALAQRERPDARERIDPESTWRCGLGCCGQFGRVLGPRGFAGAFSGSASSR